MPRTPQPGTIVRVDLNEGFRPPEMWITAAERTNIRRSDCRWSRSMGIWWGASIRNPEARPAAGEISPYWPSSQHMSSVRGRYRMRMALNGSTLCPLFTRACTHTRDVRSSPSSGAEADIGWRPRRARGGHRKPCNLCLLKRSSLIARAAYRL